MYNLHLYEPKHAKIDTADASGTVALIAAVTGKKIVVLDYEISPAAAMSLIFKSDTTVLNGKGLQFVGAVLMPHSSGFNPLGHFETAVGKGLNLTASDAGNIGGNITYIEV